MKTLIRIILTTLIFAVPVCAGADNNVDCKLIGSWVGYDANGAVWWTSTLDGQNASQGTANLETPGAVAFFPGAAAVTELKGVWKRTGGDTYDWTMLGFAYDAFGTTLTLGKLSGKDTISQDCNTVYVTDVAMEVFLPTADVNTDAPIATVPFPDHEGHRIQVDLPVLP
jgi:hypothetical protein